jgi:hypothetical protein
VADRQRQIDIPAKDWLSDKEAAEFLGISEEEFARRLKERSVPKGSYADGKTRQWYWEWVLGIKLLRPWLDRVAEHKRSKQVKRKPKNPPGTVGN